MTECYQVVIKNGLFNVLKVKMKTTGLIRINCILGVLMEALFRVPKGCDVCPSPVLRHVLTRSKPETNGTILLVLKCVDLRNLKGVPRCGKVLGRREKVTIKKTRVKGK